ncbi:MAG TPA: HK97 family phage prohead protease [Nocardioides sp.]|uniref:HK97 family phage prohead protease n=1 Tax=Nocardioides sp. TaxID=35761 RepID=UPI002ED78ACF
MPEQLTTFDNPVAARFEVDEAKRTIKGLAVPYGTTAKGFQFSKGTLNWSDPSRVKILIAHDFDRAVGVVTGFDDTDEGLWVTARIAKGAAGDEALSMAAEGVWDGLSIGLGTPGRFAAKDGIQHAVAVPLREVSITPVPAFEDARIHSVAASAAQTRKEPTMGDETTQTVEPAADFSQVTTAVRDGITEAFSTLQFPQREIVPAAAGGAAAVTEELPYRFDGTKGEHSFSADIQAAYFSNDGEARQRLETFMEEAFARFAVTSTNTGALNPTQNRPELYVPQLAYTRPLWELVSTGTLEDKTPFTVPKFSSASGLVGNHTEGVEPTPGAFAATSQTITPGPVSGKIEINREVWDQGGSPQADQIIWNEMVNAYFEAIEAKIATALATVGTAELNLAGATDGALVGALTGYFAGLQFVRGGNRFTAFAADGNLFPALVAAKDAAGRPLLPVLGPTNAQGTTDGGFDRVQVGNQTVRAAWALGTGNDKTSYNFVPSSVWAWASAPKQFKFEYQLKSIDMGIWGYTATAILRDSDVKPVDYTTADA